MYKMRNAGHQPPQSYPGITKPSDKLEHIQLDVYYPLIQKKTHLTGTVAKPGESESRGIRSSKVERDPFTFH